MLITAGIHGGEMESIAAVLNLLGLMETGVDLKGEPWPIAVLTTRAIRDMPSGQFVGQRHGACRGRMLAISQLRSGSAFSMLAIAAA